MGGIAFRFCVSIGRLCTPSRPLTSTLAIILAPPRHRTGETRSLVVRPNSAEASGGSPAYPTLSDDHLERIRRYGVRQPISVGDLIYRVGEPVSDLVLVERGAIDIFSASTAHAPEIFITRHTQGRFLGELTLLTGQFSYLVARVAVAGYIYRIPPSGFRRLMAEDADLSAILLEAFQARRELVKGLASHTMEILGSTASSGSLALRSFAERFDLPHVWFDSESVAGLALMQSTGVTRDQLPVVFIPGGALRRATPRRLAERLGLSYRHGENSVDLVIVGAGPAGMAAAVYGSSEGLTTVLLDTVSPGGQAAASSRIENYLGFPNGISGTDLTNKACVQALKFGAHIYAPTEVVGLMTSDTHPVLRIGDGSEISSKAVIIATGAQYSTLPIPGWAKFERAGIYFSATKLEATACAGRPVVIVGGANSAGQAALFLANSNCRVDVVIRGPELSAGMSSYLAERLVSHPRIQVLPSTEVTALDGGETLQEVTLTNTVTGHSHREECAALFCFIGATPATQWLTGIAVDSNNFILTDVNLDVDAFQIATAPARVPFAFETSAPNVFAAGDVRHGSMKRVAAAVGEGASAVASVHQAIHTTP
ncbi:FAD-dependent oxidoreductase [Lacisediminihabitans changchengi]|uniref:FAD-dependent oxidoreductase n=1 Tax=Lacisediminihabitans changchengi TaxID=2787634 RepID=A0A934SQ89_9MICO|nr:FAD-dependent oxidoreductase [Lacisediminihabitans changchengi]MBK4346985.1 FAD-dependent oxidoreductase [Lacisediminihabitans changchengi]MBK4347892.1 FAD-dependent oxidoreductase [Lacisediminihabitans changchengi]